MTPEERGRLRELADSATPGPWRTGIDGRTSDAHFHIGGLDAEFIAAARSAVPALLDALDAAEVRLVDVVAGREIERTMVSNAAVVIQDLQARITAVRAVLNDPGGPDSWSHTFEGQQAVFAADVQAALDGGRCEA